MLLSAASYKDGLRINAQRCLTEESDFVKVDDTWLKMAKILMDSLRHDLQDERMLKYKVKDAEGYVELAMAQAARRKGAITRAGEMICRYLELDED